MGDNRDKITLITPAAMPISRFFSVPSIHLGDPARAKWASRTEYVVGDFLLIDATGTRIQAEALMHELERVTAHTERLRELVVLITSHVMRESEPTDLLRGAMFGRGGSRDNKTKDVEQMHLWLSRLDEPLEIAHEIGESFFKPVDTANVLVNQAVLRSDRMSRLEQRYGLLSSAQVAQLSGSKARNKAQIAHRWLKQGKIFAVPIQGAVRFPGFQFDEFGQPRGVIADILTVLPMERGWATAFWFDNPNSVICENKSPAQVLDSDPAAALEAARAAHSRAEEDWA